MRRKHVTALLVALTLVAGLGMAQTGRGQTSDPQPRCAAGDGAACFDAGLALERAGQLTPDRWRMIADLYRRSCELGRDAGCRNLANLEMSGLGTARDPTRAIARYEGLCARRLSSACRGLANWLNGQFGAQPGFAIDKRRARYLYGLGCDAGDGTSCTFLADIHYRGVDVPKDLQAALALYVRACNAPNPKMSSCHDAGIVSAQLGLAAEQIVPWYERACAADHWPACNNLAAILDARPNVGGNRTRAMQLLERACTVGNSAKACDNLTALRRAVAGVAATPARAGTAPAALSCGEIETKAAATINRVTRETESATNLIRNYPNMREWKMQDVNQRREEGCNRLVSAYDNATRNQCGTGLRRQLISAASGMARGDGVCIASVRNRQSSF